MFTEKELEKYADIMIWGLTAARTGDFAEGDAVLLRYDLLSIKLAEALYTQLIKKGLNVSARMNVNANMEKSFYSNAQNPQLDFKTPGDKEYFENLNGLISLIAPESLTHLAGIDSAKIGRAAVARKYLREIMEERENKGLFGWTLCIYPTQAMADAADLSMEEYKNQVAKSCFLDQDDPVAKWNDIYNQAMEVKNWLNALPISTVRVQSESMDLKIGIGEQRRFMGISGHNIPSFELFLSPDMNDCEGVYYSDQPSYRSGNLVQGVRLEFKNGRVVSSSAEKGEEFLRKQLAMDDGASRLGEFSLTDKRFSRIDKFMANTLYDENYGGENGNCHVAVGDSYADTYDGDPSELTRERKKELGFNDSALHWDLVNTEKKTVTATLKDGGELVIYDDGMFTL